jgi:hypothetical protein
MNHALKVEASKLRSVLAVRSSRVARLPRDEARAMSTRDAVLHFAAEYPAQAAVMVTRAAELMVARGAGRQFRSCGYRVARKTATERGARVT